jgi:hypothetical protein
MKTEPSQRIRLDQATAKIVRQYFEYLPIEMKQPFTQFENILNRNEALTPGQHTYLDGMYESVLGSLTGIKVPVHIDLKNKSKSALRY